MRRATSRRPCRRRCWCFNSRPSCDGRHVRSLASSRNSCFNSRPSCDGRLAASSTSDMRYVSIHARHATGDLKGRICDAVSVFQFTPVMRRATVTVRKLRIAQKFQFTPVMRRATCLAQQSLRCLVFQFTPVMRRATRGTRPSPRGTPRFNSRPSCDGRQEVRKKPREGLVSIHARHATGDVSSRRARRCSSFQFTPVMRRATRAAVRRHSVSCFNSRPSCDGRPHR